MSILKDTATGLAGILGEPQMDIGGLIEAGAAKLRNDALKRDLEIAKKKGASAKQIQDIYDYHNRTGIYKGMK